LKTLIEGLRKNRSPILVLKAKAFLLPSVDGPRKPSSKTAGLDGSASVPLDQPSGIRHVCTDKSWPIPCRCGQEMTRVLSAASGN